MLKNACYYQNFAKIMPKHQGTVSSGMLITTNVIKTKFCCEIGSNFQNRFRLFAYILFADAIPPLHFLK